MRKTIAATTTALTLALAGTAFANGGPSFNTTVNFDAGTGGKASISGTIEGGTYAKGKNGFDAFAKSVNRVETYGLSDVDLGESSNYGLSTSWGKSRSVTNGPGALAEAFEQRSLSFSNFTRFNVDVSGSKTWNFGGFGQFQ